MMIFDVSVIIPVFNAELFLEKAIHSVLVLEEVKEVILVDDGSTDSSWQICNEFADKYSHVYVFKHPEHKNKGVSATRNLGIQKASCNFIAFLDADDFFLTNRFTADKKNFNENIRVDGVYNAIGVYFYTKDGEQLFNKYMKKSSLTTVYETVSPEELFFTLSMTGKYIGYFSLDGLTLKRSALSKMDHLFDEHLRFHEDTEFLIRLSYYTRLVGGELKTPVTLRGVHDSNTIIGLRNDKRKIIEKQILLWDSLLDWSLEKNLALQYQQHFSRMSKVYNLLNDHDKLLIPKVTRLLVKDKELFFKSCYYNPIHYNIFGNSVFSKVLVRIKQIIQRIFNFPVYQTFNQ